MQKQALLNSVKRLFNPKFIDNLIYVLIGFWLIVKLIDFTTISISYQAVYTFQIKISKVLCVCFFLYYLYKWCDCSKVKLNLILCVIFLIAAYFLNKYTKTQLVYDLFFIPLFICQFLNKEKFYKYVLVSFCLFFVIELCLYFSGYVHDSDTFFRQNGMRRYALGFIHPNALGFYVMLFCLYSVMLKTSFKFYDYLIFLVLAYFCYKIPNSITSASLIFLLAVFVFLSNIFLRKNLSKKINYLLLILSLLSVALVLFFTYYITFTEAFKADLQSLPGSIWARFELSKKGYEIFGFSLLGKYDEFIAMAVSIIQNYGPKAMWLILDCTYFYLPIIHGLIVYAIFMFMLIWSFVRGIVDQKYLYALIMFVVVIYGVSETTIFRSVMMPLFAYTFFSSLKTTDRSKELQK